VNEKFEAEVTQISAAIAQIGEYVHDKFRGVSGDLQQVRRNAEDISKVKATLGELQNEVASGNSSTPQSAEPVNAIGRVLAPEQQGGSASSSGTTTLPRTEA